MDALYDCLTELDDRTIEIRNSGRENETTKRFQQVMLDASEENEGLCIEIS